jgi:hypothetical protein
MIHGARYLFLLLTIAMVGAGCIVVHDDHDVVAHTTIDAGIELQTQLGEGAGVFVEYQSGGHWRIWTSCDTFLTDRSCDFEIRATAAFAIDALVELGLEGADHVDLFGEDTAVFYAHTSVGSDAVEILAPAGEALQIEVVLDGTVAPDYLVWFGSGHKHMGASSSPTVFEPNAD